MSQNDYDNKIVKLYVSVCACLYLLTIETSYLHKNETRTMTGFGFTIIMLRVFNMHELSFSQINIEHIKMNISGNKEKYFCIEPVSVFFAVQFITI